MMQSLSDLLPGNAEVEEAVLVQQRPKWSIPVMLVGGLIVAVATGAFGFNNVVSGALIGLVIAAVFVATTENFILAKTADATILASGKKGSPEAVDVVKTIDETTSLERRKGLLNDALVIDGTTYLTSRAFRGRLDTIVD